MGAGADTWQLDVDRISVVAKVAVIAVWIRAKPKAIQPVIFNSSVSVVKCTYVTSRTFAASGLKIGTTREHGQQNPFWICSGPDAPH